MPKKFEPTPELLEQILSLYKKTKNYSAVSRETGLSTTIIKRIIQEANTSPTIENAEKPLPKPKTTAQILAYYKEYQYTGLPPVETSLPKKAAFYGQAAQLRMEFLDV